MKQRKLQGLCENSSHPFFQFNATFATQIEQYNLTKNQSKVLFYLRYSRRAWHTLKTPVKCLAKVLNMALSSLYAALARLSALGLIKVNKYVQTATDCKPWAINWVQFDFEKDRSARAREKTLARKAKEEANKKAEEAAKKAAAQAEAEKFVAATQSHPTVAKATEPVAYNPNRPFDPAYDPRPRDEQGKVQELKLSPESEAIRAKLLAEAAKREKIKNLGYDIDRLRNRPTS